MVPSRRVPPGHRALRADPATLLGSGKIGEIRAWAEAEECDFLLFDHDLTPSQHRNLERELRRVEADADDGVLVIQSAQGVDYPKTRDRKQNQIRDGRNRLYFHWTVDPPLRVSVFRRRR